MCVRAHLLDVLLEHTQLQPLVQSDLAVLPDVLQAPLMVQDLVDHVQDAVDLQEGQTISEKLRPPHRRQSGYPPPWSSWP